MSLFKIEISDDILSESLKDAKVIRWRGGVAWKERQLGPKDSLWLVSAHFSILREILREIIPSYSYSNDKKNKILTTNFDRAAMQQFKKRAIFESFLAIFMLVLKVSWLYSF